MIKGIKFASIPVKDQDRALEFYTERLGFRIITDQRRRNFATVGQRRTILPWGVRRICSIGRAGSISRQ